MSASNSRPIIFGPGDKLRWLEAVAFNSDSTDFEARLAIALSNRIYKYTGLATIDQIWLARKIGGSDRGVRKALAQMIKKGHLIIERQSRGRGWANVYRPVSRLEVGSRNGGSVLDESKTRNAESAISERINPKTGTSVPPLPNNYQITSPEQVPTTNDLSSGHWRSVKDKLAIKFGRGVVNSWFDVLVVVEMTSDTVVMMAPNTFIRRYVEAHYLEDLTGVWHCMVSTIERIQIVGPSSKRM